MRTRFAVPLGLLAVATAVLAAVALPARGETRAEQLLREAEVRGRALFEQEWVAGGKTCASCHASGRNQMKVARVKAFPKYDREADAVISIQQKINQMIETKSGGAPLELGSADLTALEAHLSTLR
jgi:cytochrome c